MYDKRTEWDEQVGMEQNTCTVRRDSRCLLEKSATKMQVKNNPVMPIDEVSELATAGRQER